MNKRLISIGLSVTLLFSVTGCGVVGTGSDDIIDSMVESRQTEKERVIEEAKAYLSENYPDDEFTYVSGRSPEWAYNYYELAFTSKKYDNQEVIVYGDPQKDDNPNSVVTSYYKDDNGNVIYDYFDTYYQYYMKNEAEEYFYNLAGEYLSGDFSVEVEMYDGFGFAYKVDNSKGFIDNALSDNLTYWIDFKIDCDPNSIVDNIQCILERLVKEKIYVANVYFLNYEKESDDSPLCKHYTTREGIIKEK